MAGRLKAETANPAAGHEFQLNCAAIFELPLQVSPAALREAETNFLGVTHHAPGPNAI